MVTNDCSKCSICGVDIWNSEKPNHAYNRQTDRFCPVFVNGPREDYKVGFNWIQLERNHSSRGKKCESRRLVKERREKDESLPKRYT